MMQTIRKESLAGKVGGWSFGLLLCTIGVLNLVLVHAVPGTAYLIFSLFYFPPVTAWLKRKWKLGIPVLLKILTGIILIWFTLGISDLGEILGF